VRRDEHGKMDDLKEWSWWALEMMRRTLREYWAGDVWDDQKGKGKRRGKGGEGCVILVDANGAGYRNLVRSLPHFKKLADRIGSRDATHSTGGWT
jgi:hypothetical protein